MSRARRLRILLGALPLQFAFGMVYSWGAVAPYVQQEVHWPAVVVSAVFSATPIGYGTGIVIGGRLADRVPPRRLCWAGLALLASGLAIALSFPSELTFTFFYSMLGLGFGGGVALAGSIAAGRHAIPDLPGAAGGLVTAAYAVAAPIQVPVGSLLAAAFGWLAALRLQGTVMLAVAALTLALMPAVPAPAPGPGPAASEATARQTQPRLLSLLRRPRVWTAILLELAATPLGSWAFVYMSSFARGLALAAAVAPAAITAVAVGNAAGRLGAGAASDRFGVDRVLAAFLLVDLAAAGLLFAANGSPLLVATALLAGAAFGAPAGVVSRLAADAAPDAPNSAFGLIFTGFAAGAGSGSLLGALVGGRQSWLVLALLPLAGLAVVALRLRLRPGPVPAPRTARPEPAPGPEGRTR